MWGVIFYTLLYNCVALIYNVHELKKIMLHERKRL